MIQKPIIIFLFLYTIFHNNIYFPSKAVLKSQSADVVLGANSLG